MTKFEASPRTEVRTGERTPRAEVRGLIYHVWFSPKRRKPLLEGDIASAAVAQLRISAVNWGIDLLECETFHDHVHLLVALPADLTLPDAMRYMKGASARRLFQRFPELKLDTGLERFWQRGYGARQLAPSEIRAVRSHVRSHRADREPRSSLRGVGSIG
jgi:putative transposase